MKQRDPDKTQLITFYSYKGGVGRTMALANAACQLAIRHGKKVICVDWDLEAPGLHHYFGYTDEELAGRAGLLDYLADFVLQVKREGSAGRIPELKTYLQPLKEKDREKIIHGSVQLMHCGRTDANYMVRVQEFDWEDFYRNCQGYRIIETFKRQLCEEADMALIDARAGQADVGATPTIQVPDAVVILFTSNRQNLRGSEEIARRISRHPMRAAQKLDPPKVLLVPARVFPQEDRFHRWIEQATTVMFDPLVRDEIVSRQDQPKGLYQCQIPVDARYSIDESLAVLESGPVRSQLADAYVDLAQALNNLHLGRRAWGALPGELGAGPELGPAEELRAELERAAGRGDKDQVALLQFKLAQQAIAHRKFDEAEALLASCLAYNKTVNNLQAIGAIHYEQGNIRQAERKLDEAWSLYERALKLKEEAGDVREQGMTLHQMGNVRQAERKFDEAWSLYERALRSEEEAGDVRGQAVTLYSMGRLKMASGSPAAAEPILQRGLARAEQAGDQEGIRLFREALSELARTQKEPADSKPAGGKHSKAPGS